MLRRFMDYLTKLKAIEAKTKLSDQTIISKELLGWKQDLEVQQIRGTLNDQKNKIGNLTSKMNQIRGIVE